MRTTQKKGDIGAARAIFKFTELGYDVSIPLTESAAYDLIVDTGTELKRVQVKYSTDGKVDLRHIHSNAQGYVVSKVKENAYDWLFVCTPDNDYLVKECLSERTGITMNKKYQFGEFAIGMVHNLENC